MLREKASICIQQPIEEVFRFVATDFKGDGRSEIPFQVTQDDSYHTFCWKALQPDEAHGASSWQASAQVLYTFEPLPDGTQLTCEYQLSLGRGFKRKLAEWYLVRPLRAEVQQWVANLKELVENPTSAAFQQRKDGQEESALVIQPEERPEVQMRQVGQTPSRKPFPKMRVILVITGLIALLFSLAILHDYTVYQSYVQGTCAITAARVTFGGRAPAYHRYYEFTVSTTGGQSYASHDSPGSYYTADEAQAALTQYEVGATYPCWYNPANPTRATLSYAPSPLVLELLYTFLAFVGYSFGIGLALLLVVYAIVPALYLLVRGQRTPGRVVGSLGSGRSRKVRVSYTIADKVYELNTQMSALKIGRTVTVLYDPRGVIDSLTRSRAYEALFVGTPLTLIILVTVLYGAYWSWFMTV